MKRLKLLLVLMSVLALCVAGLAVTSFANDVSEDTLYTVDGIEYVDPDESFDLISEESQVVVYQECFLYYVDGASYTVAGGADIVASVIKVEDEIINFVSADDVSSTEVVPGDTVTIYTPCTKVPVLDGVNYVVSENSGIAFSATNFATNEIDFVAEADFKTYRYGFNSWTEGYIIKLLSDVSYTRDLAVGGEAEAGALGAFVGGTEAANKAVYLDLNGYTLFGQDIGEGATTRSIFTLCGKQYRDTYFFSSREGGKIVHAGKNADGGLVYPNFIDNLGASSSVYIGKVTYDGVTYPGDNLSIYSATLYVGNSNTNQKVVVDGGSYYNLGGKGVPTVKANIVDGSISIENAFLYSNGGRYFTLDGNSGAVKVNNCVFLADAKYVSPFIDKDNDGVHDTDKNGAPLVGDDNTFAFLSLATTTNVALNISNSAIAYTDPAMRFWTVVGGSSYTSLAEGKAVPVYDNCILGGAAKIMGKHMPVAQNLENSIAKEYSVSIPAFADGGVSFTASPIAIAYDKLVSTQYSNYHNITLGSDLIYNVYIPAFASDVKLNGNAVIPKYYSDFLNVISISVPAYKLLDDYIITYSLDGEKSVSVSVNDYVEAAAKAYSDDPTFIALLSAVRDYAKAAAAYNGNYNQEGFVYDYSAVLPTATGKAGADVSEAFKAVISGAKLRLDGEIAFVFGVAKNAAGEVSITYSYGRKTVTRTFDVAGESEITIKVKAIDLNSDIKVVAAGETLTYNLQNYIYEMSSKGDEALMTLLTYIENYAQCANVYKCTGHVAAEPEVQNLVENTLDVDGSYTEIIRCSECGGILSEKEIILEAPLKNFTYEAKDDGTYKVLGLKEGVTVTELTFPEIVSEIAAEAFKGNTVITKVTIPDTVTSLGASAFDGCSALEYAYVGKGITSVPSRAFAVCQKLKLLVFSEGLKSINSNYPFYNGHVDTIIIIPSTVETLSRASFQIAKAKVFFNGTQEEWISKFGDYQDSTFTDGNYKSAHELDDYDGSNNKDNTGGARLYFYSEEAPEVDGRHWKYAEDGVTPEIWPWKYERENLYNFTYTRDANGNYTVTGLSEQGLLLSEITFPDKVVAIGNSAFYGNANLVRVVIPDTVKTIGQDAFRGCTALQYLTIGKGVTELPNNMLYSTNTLKEVRIEGSITKMGSNVFYNTCSTGNNRYDLYLPEAIVLGQYFRFAKVNIHYAGTAAQWKAIPNNTPSALNGSGTPLISIYDKDGVEITFD